MGGGAAGPTFSVLLCNRDDARYLPSALSSILDGQDPGPDQVLLVDDASTDDSLAVMEAWADRFSCVEIVRNDRNLGPLESANRALPRVRGDYVGWWSADDVVMPGIFARAAAAARRHPAAAVVASATEVADEARPDRPPRRHGFGLGGATAFLDPAAFAAANRVRYLWMGSSGLFLRTDLLCAAGGWTPAFDWFADWAMSYGLALTHGAALVEETGSRVLERADSHGAAARADPTRRRRALAAFLRFLDSPAGRDLRPRFAAATLVWRYALGNPVFAEMLKRPRDWDLLVRTGTAWARHRIAGRLRRLSPAPR